MINKEKVMELYCAWCPRDNAVLCKRDYCFSAKGFAENIEKEICQNCVGKIAVNSILEDS